MTKKKYSYKELILAVVCILIAAVVIFFDYNDVESTCKRHPERCVCEKVYDKEYESEIRISSGVWDAVLSGEYNYGIKDCTQFRKKTSEEFEIDKCNECPTCGGICTCLRYENQSYSWGYQSFWNPDFNCVWNITKRDCEKQLNVTIKENGIVPAKVTGCLMAVALRYENARTFEERCPLIEEVVHFNKTRETCVAARPKDECEKGNPDYQRVIKPVQKVLTMDDCSSQCWAIKSEEKFSECMMNCLRVNVTNEESCSKLVKIK